MTVCKTCGNRSERDSDFLEIEVNLEVSDGVFRLVELLTKLSQNNATLESRVVAMLAPEELSGDNKFVHFHQLT